MRRIIEQLRPFITSIFETDEWIGATTGLYHAGGDAVTLGFKQVDGKMHISDLRSATRALRQNKAKPPSEDGDFAHSLLADGLIYRGGEVYMLLLDQAASSDATTSLLPAVKRVIEASLAISSKSRYSRGPHASHFEDVVADFLEKFVGDRAEIQRHWIDYTRDETGAFPVDFRINGYVEEQHLHVVGSDGKADRAALSSLFHKQRHPSLRVIMILAPGWSPGPTPYTRMASSSDKIVQELDHDKRSLLKALRL